MPAILYLSRVPDSLQLDAERQIPDAWAKWDLVSQGLVSRYLARTARSSKADVTEKSSPWVMLHPFVARRPSVYGIWNSTLSLSEADLESLRGGTTECHVDATAFSAAELKTIRKFWPEFREWTP